MALVLLWQSHHKRNIFSLNHPPTSSPSARNNFLVFLDPCFICMFLYVLRNSLFSEDIYLQRTLGSSPAIAIKQKLFWITPCLDILGYFRSILEYIPQMLENFI